MKKVLCVACALLILFSLASCSNSHLYPLSAQDTNITKGVYAYYLDKVLSNAKSYDVKADDDEAVKQKALQLCKEHIAAASLMKEYGLTLSQELKSEIASETESVWSLFGQYYKSIGVTKSDITAVNTFKAQKNQLVEYYYGSDGKKSVSDDTLKQKFVEMYVGFKAFEGTFTKVNVKGETIDMTEKEREKLISEFRKMANKINDGASIDDVYEQYCQSQGLVATGKLEVILMKKGDPMYADDFFDKVLTVSHSKAAPVTSGSSVYVIERCTIASSGEDAFEEYRTEVLRELKMPAIEKLISSKIEKIETQEDNRAISEVSKAVYKIHNSKD